MNLNTKSWHFRYLSFTARARAREIEYRGNVSLCSYFWTIVFSMVVDTAALCFIAFMAIAVFMFMFVEPVLAIINGVLTEQALVGLVIWAALASLISWVLLSKFIQSRSEKAVARKPNILVEYVKARKAKVCPIMYIEKGE